MNDKNININGLAVCCINVEEKRAYEWRPKDDITAYQLALCTPMFSLDTGFVDMFYDRLPENAKRHFEVVILE
jgi:hypothetical protein